MCKFIGTERRASAGQREEWEVIVHLVQISVCEDKKF